MRVRSYVIRRADGGRSILLVIGVADPLAEFRKWAKVADPAWLPATLGKGGRCH